MSLQDPGKLSQQFLGILTFKKCIPFSVYAIILLRIKTGKYYPVWLTMEEQTVKFKNQQHYHLCDTICNARLHRARVISLTQIDSYIYEVGEAILPLLRTIRCVRASSVSQPARLLMRRKSQTHTKGAKTYAHNTKYIIVTYGDNSWRITSNNNISIC